MRIGFLCSEFPPDPHGGIGVYTRDLAGELARRGHEVYVVGWSDRNEVTRQDGIHVQRIRRPDLGRLPHLSVIQSCRHLARNVRELAGDWKLDVLEVPDYRGESAWFTRFPCPVLLRGHGPVGVLAKLAGRRPSRLIAHLEGRALRLADGRSSVSQFLEDHLVERWGLKSSGRVIPNFVDRHRFRPDETVKRDPQRLLIVGRLGRAKGLDDLLPVLCRILEKNPEATLELVGSDHEGLVERFVRGLDESVARRVVSAGQVQREALPSVYTRASFVVIPARAETFSLVALEAMACGCVPVAWKKSGPAEFLARNKVGRLVENREDWEEELSKLLLDPTDLDEMRARCRQVVETRFSTEVVVPLFEDLYTDHARRGGAR